MKDNRHLVAIPEEVLAQVRSLLAQIISLLAPYALAITAEEYRAMLKMGNKSFAFVEKAFELAKQNPGLCPPFLDMEAFEIDFKDAHQLIPVINESKQIAEIIADICAIAGSEAFKAALIFYNASKVAAENDVPGAKTVYEELRKRFPKGKHRQ